MYIFVCTCVWCMLFVHIAMAVRATSAVLYVRNSAGSQVQDSWGSFDREYVCVALLMSGGLV